MPRLGARRRVVLAAGALVAATILALLGYRNLATWGETEIGGPQPIEIISNSVAAWAFGIAGIVAMHRRPQNRAGSLMVLIGTSFLAWTWVYLPVPPLVTLGYWASQAPVVLLGILVLTYPSGRFTSDSGISPPRSLRSWPST